MIDEEVKDTNRTARKWCPLAHGKFSFVCSPFAASMAAAGIYKFVFVDDEEAPAEPATKEVHEKDSGSEEP